MELVDWDEEEWATRAARALCREGGVRIRLDAPAAATVARLLAAAKSFFDDADAKRATSATPRADPDTRCGYVHTAARQVFELHPTQAGTNAAIAAAATHTTAAAMTAVARLHSESCLQLSSQVLHALGAIIDVASLANIAALDDGRFDASLLRVYQYNGEGSSSDAGCLFPPHEDLGLLTLAPAATVPGLEALVRGGWVAVEPSMGRDELFLFGGSILAYVSGGQVPALVHRVCCSARGRRITAPFFFRPSLEVPIFSASPGSHEPVLAARFIRDLRKARACAAEVAIGREGLNAHMVTTASNATVDSDRS